MAIDNNNQLENPGPAPDEGGEPTPARRAASAEFVVQGGIGSEAALREAMDPANQSLADSLRLSYRVLQIVIVILLVLFLVSGVRTVEPTQSGVMLRFGAIQADADGTLALEPGLQFNWPFPAGEFVLVDVQNRSVDLRNTFWPNIGGATTIEQAIEASHPNVGLKPGQDGYVIVQGSDLAHLKINAKYEIRTPQGFLECIDEKKADTLVTWALQRATIHTAAKLSLNDLTERAAEVREMIRSGAQDTLDSVQAGIRISDVTIPDTRPPLAIVKAQRELQETIVRSQDLVEQARQQADKELIAVAGQRHRQLYSIIERFEDALSAEDDEAAEAVFLELRTAMTGPDAAGEIAETIERARAYQSEVESTLGSESRLFSSLMRAYRDSPRLVVQRRWLEAYQTVMNARDTEVIYVPSTLAKFRLEFDSDQRIAVQRRQSRLDALEMKSMEEALGFNRSITSRELAIDGPGSRIDVDEQGRVISTKDR